MTMKDLHDHTSAVEHLRTGCALEVARLGWRDLVIDDHELCLWRCLRITLDLRFRLLLVGVLEVLASLRLSRDRHRSDDARPAGERRELLEAPCAEQRPAADS